MWFLFHQGESHKPLKPDKHQLERFREYRLRVMIMARVLVELGFYMIFAWALMVICYGRRDTGHFWMTNGIDELLPKFDKVMFHEDENSNKFYIKTPTFTT